jgi:glycosyltransferase involved in cell wall biosynthesis
MASPLAIEHPRPEVSVIIPTYDRWPMLGEAVASVLAQREVHLELIVVDDGSRDESSAHLARMADESRARSAHPIHVLRTENLGPAAARNAGSAIACSPFIAFLDSDDLWAPNKLKRQLDWMRQTPGYEIAQTEEIWIRKGRRVNPGRRHRKRAGDVFIDSLRTCLISPSAVIMGTSLFRHAGGFDPLMRAAEDYDLWLRVLAEYPIGLLPEPLVTRRAGHPGQLSATTPAIDRFRIVALLKLLARDDLDRERRHAVCDALIEKCRIYGAGAARRGRVEEAHFVAELAKLSGCAWLTSPDIALQFAIDRSRRNFGDSDFQVEQGLG